MNDSASIWRRVCCRISACDSDVKDFQVLTATFSPESVQVHQYSRVAFPDHERLGENSNAVVVFGFAVTIACIFVQMMSTDPRIWTATLGRVWCARGSSSCLHSVYIETPQHTYLTNPIGPFAVSYTHLTLPTILLV